MSPRYVDVLISITCEYFVRWQRGIKVADGIKIVNQLTFCQGDYPELSKWTQVTTRVLKSGTRDRRGSQSNSV